MSDVRYRLQHIAAKDPGLWRTGLSVEGARRALHEALRPLRAFPLDPPEKTPESLLIWCAGNVFTAPLEWVAWFHHLGTPRIVLKAPMACPRPVIEIADSFGAEVAVLQHERAFHLLDEADAVLAFGSDEAMGVLRHRTEGKRRCLFGHKVSFAIVAGEDDDTAAALALDAALYDGAGCMSPAAVFHLGDAEAFAAKLARHMKRLALELPRGEPANAIGPHWRRRTGLARIHGTSHEGDDWAVPVLPLHYAESTVLPRMLPVHAIDHVDQLKHLGQLPLSTCGTDVSVPLPFWRICRPGQMQTPPLRREHDGTDVIKTLCAPGAAT